MTTRLLFHRTVAAAALTLSFALTVSVLPVEVWAANATVKVVSPAEGAVVYWSNVAKNETYDVEVSPKNPADPPACFMAILEYRDPPGSWTFISGVSGQISQKHQIHLPVSWFGDDALYRIKAAGNPGCKAYDLGDDGKYVWTDWNQYSIKKKELTAFKKDQFEAVSKKPIEPVFGSKAALQKGVKVPAGPAPSTPMSGDAPPGFGTAITARSAAVKTTGFPTGGPAGGGSSKVKVLKPADGTILYWTYVTGKERWSVEVAPVDPADPPPCYNFVIQYRKPHGNWVIMSGLTDKISQPYWLSFAITHFGDDADYRIKAAGNEACKNFNFADEGSYVWTGWNDFNMVAREPVGLKGDQYRAIDKKPIQPTLKSKVALSKDMKTLPGGEPMTPRSGDAPPGFGKAHPVPATKMTKVKLLPGNLVIDEFILKTDDPQPGHTVDVKVKVRNGGQGPTVKDEWKLVVKCYKSPGGDACEQQLGPVKLAAIPKGGVVWKTLPGAVKVNSFGSYKLQANVWGGSSAFSGYLDFKVNMPKADQKKMKQVPVDLPGPGPQVQETAPAPRKITPQRQQIQVR